MKSNARASRESRAQLRNPSSPVLPLMTWPLVERTRAARPRTDSLWKAFYLTDEQHAVPTTYGRAAGT